ncbi:MAG: ribonuclease P protein component [bacterium]|nr:ribonuclease P protein component [bacterium]
MLARPLRLRAASDFNKVYKLGRSAHGRFILAKALDNRLDISRCAVVVSKKISKKATLRNRAKRRINEIVRKNWQKINPGFNIVIVAKAGSPEAENILLEKDITLALSKLGVWGK